MSANHQPFISSQERLAEITCRGVILSIVLAVILAMANAYLALKAGILTSASIPAAVISMGVLRFFRNSNVLENNLVQTAASAGEAVAGGIVYTIPALVMIGYWNDFAYWENVVIALCGGVLGVLFSIPMRHVLVTAENLRFPEGRAIAEVLKTSVEEANQVKYMLLGGAIGSVLELVQTGFKVVASSWQVWFVARRALFGFGAGFSAAMIGAGYLVGFNIALSIFFGAMISWMFGVPLLSELLPHSSHAASPTLIVVSLWEHKLRYVGIGAMLCAGVWTFITLLRPFSASLRMSYRAMTDRHFAQTAIERTEKDMPMQYVLLGLLVVSIAILLFFHFRLPLSQLNLSALWQTNILVALFSYVLIVGFIFCAITGYFSGLVGVTASPGSAVIIGGMLLVSLILFVVCQHAGAGLQSHTQILAAEAITIFIGALITGAAAIANDNIQDLKVGHILGATPWRQQIMLLVGVLAASLIIPLVMQLLFRVYGIGGVLPAPGMDPAQSLPAPPAALLAAITQAIFHQNLPWNMLELGIVIMLAVIALNMLLKRLGYVPLSILGIATGMYLPLSTSIPLFLGGLIAVISQSGATQHQRRGVLLACGLVAGAALMDVALAVPFSIAHSPDALRLVSEHWAGMAAGLGGVSVIALAWLFYKVNR